MNRSITISLLALMLSAPLSSLAGKLDVRDGAWQLNFNNADRTVSYSFKGKKMLDGVFSTALDPSEVLLDTRKYPDVELRKQKINDEFGKGTKYTYIYSGLPGRENIEQATYVYPSLPYILVETTLVAEQGTTSSKSTD